jgi:hypothetical protein
MGPSVVSYAAAQDIIVIERAGELAEWLKAAVC